MKILVIEDNEKHLNDAKAFFSGIVGLEVIYAEDYRKSKVSEKILEVDGVISDIFFPLAKGDNTWGQEEPIGVSIMMRCREMKLPCILNTSGYHHGSRYQWICDLQRDLKLPEIVDSSGDYFKDAETKNWKYAYEALTELIKAKNK
jgi:hypothetical protein